MVISLGNVFGGGGGVAPSAITELTDDILALSAKVSTMDEVVASAITQLNDTKQDVLTAGNGISIDSANTISVTGGGGGGGVSSAEVQTMIDQSVSGKADTSAVTQSLSAKQDTLISGTNIKTINNESLLGSGNITISGGGGGSYQYYSEDTTGNTANINIETDDGEGNTGQYWLNVGDGGNGFGALAETDDGEGNTTSNDGQIGIDPIGGVTISASNSEGGQTTMAYLTVESTGVSINGDKVVTEAAFDYDPITSALTITFLNA